MMRQQDLIELEDQTVDALRVSWTSRFGDAPPPLKSADLMRRALAERIQVEAEGLDHALTKRLQLLAARHRPGRKSTPRTATFKTGSRLERLWQGERHQVDVLAEGFEWRGQTFKSLSQVARAITGVRWNGPRFFGLRGEAA